MTASLCFKFVCAVAVSALAQTSVAWAQKPKPAPTTTQSSADRRRHTLVGQPGSVAIEEAMLLTNGWARMAEGKPADAAAAAGQALAKWPRSVAALSLAVEAAMARVGAGAGLDQYEQWLNGRTVEEPGILRRIARMSLRQAATSGTDLAVKVAALRALSEDGDADAAAELSRISARSPGRDSLATRTMASTGDEAAVRKVLADLKTGSTNEVEALDALGASRSPLAVQSLVARLSDQRQEIRGAAVLALGQIGDPALVSYVKPLVSDRSLFVRARAAQSLLRLGDDSAWPMLQEMSLDESASTRLLAAESMASRPDASWLGLVHQLTQDDNPEIRANAARLLAPHEPDVARAVLESLAVDENSAIRELAAVSQSEAIPNDLLSLRRLLRSDAPMTRVRAAAQILAVTR
jgi:HEAT repeat protein